VTRVTGKDDLPAQAEGFASAWRDMRGDESIQFAPIAPPDTPEPPPDWLTEFLRALADLFGPVGSGLTAIWPVLSWVLIGLAVLVALWFLYRLYDPAGRRRSSKSVREEWKPEQRAALALLEEADQLAAAGDYDEATHLLLLRSVGQIAAARPDLVEPSSTARELAGERRLPDAARTAFGLIAAPVEKSLFALTRLSQEDWLGARAAYADFALAQKAIRA
jgi:hypothetical protein